MSSYLLSNLTYRTSLLRFLTLAFPVLALFAAGESLASVQCSEALSHFENGPVRIEAVMGVGVEEVARTSSTVTNETLIWVAKKIQWLVRFDVADIAGDSRWGHRLLGKNAKHFGFEKRHVPHGLEYSLPSIEHANMAIEKFNAEFIRQGRADEIIPFTLDGETKIASDKKFLEMMSVGKIPVGLAEGRTFLHDINYHYLEVLMMNPKLLRAIQRRAEIGLHLVSELEKASPHNPFISENIEVVTKILATDIDQMGNWIPLMEAAAFNPRMARPYINSILNNLVSANDQIYFESVLSRAGEFVKDFNYYGYKKLMSAKEIESLHEKYPYDPFKSGKSRYWDDYTIDILRKSELVNKLVKTDSSVEDAIVSIRNFIENRGIKVIEHLNRFKIEK